MCLVLNNDDLFDNLDDKWAQEDNAIKQNGILNTDNTLKAQMTNKITNTELNEGSLQKEPIIHIQNLEKDRVVYGKTIFNVITIGYFATFVFIIAVILYLLIMNEFSSAYSKYIIIFLPVAIICSVIIYAPSDTLKCFKFLPAYFYYIPAYINILQIYAICKTDDISWGTLKSPDDTDLGKINKKSNKFHNFKFKKLLYLITYVLCNSAFGFLFEW